MIATGEARAVKERGKIKVYLLIANPTIEDEGDGRFKTLGNVFEFRPEPEEVNEGISRVTYGTTEVFPLWENEEKEKWVQVRGFSMGLADYYSFLKEDPDLVIQYNKEKYAAWDAFATAFGITELESFGTKLPRPVAVRLRRLCIEMNETPSWRLRLLVEEYLEARVKVEARRILFEG